MSFDFADFISSFLSLTMSVYKSSWQFGKSPHPVVNVYRDGGHLSVSETHEISILLSLAPALLSRYGGQLFTPMELRRKEFHRLSFRFHRLHLRSRSSGWKKSLKPFVIGDFWGYFYYCCYCVYFIASVMLGFSILLHKEAFNMRRDDEDYDEDPRVEE